MRRFGRIHDPRRGWAPKGCRPDVPAQSIREYLYPYSAACYLILPAMDGACMNVFLGELASRYPNHCLLVVYDGAPCHSPGALDLPKHLAVVTLPPYSPQLNPCEHNWDQMHEKFLQNLVFNSLDAVEDQLVTACNFYESKPDIIHSMTAWNWIVNY